jgi:hypothetical protein
MAVSGKTAAPQEIPYYLGTDKPPDMAAVTKAMADQVHARLNALGLASCTSKLINTEESRTNTEFGTLATADEVKLTLAEAGLLVVGFMAEVKSSVAAAGQVALFINGTQVARFEGGASVNVAGTTVGTGFCFVTTAQDKLNVKEGVVGVATTGLLLMATGTAGGLMVHGAPAAEYTITARYKATSGSVTAKNRRLYAYGLS